MVIRDSLMEAVTQTAKITDPYLSLLVQNEAKRFKIKTGVFLFLIQGSQILLSRKTRAGIDDGRYSVPTGGLESNETLTAALIREAQEQTNIVLKNEHLLFCHAMHRNQPMLHDLSFQQIDFFFRADHYDGLIKNKEPDQCELRFYSLNNLPPTVPFIRHAIDCMLKGQIFSEYGWEKNS